MRRDQPGGNFKYRRYFCNLFEPRVEILLEFARIFQNGRRQRNPLFESSVISRA